MGQALIEYILIFGFMIFLSVNFVKSLNTTMSKSVGSLAYELTEQLSVGACKKNCFVGSSFLNMEK